MIKYYWDNDLFLLLRLVAHLPSGLLVATIVFMVREHPSLLAEPFPLAWLLAGFGFSLILLLG